MKLYAAILLSLLLPLVNHASERATSKMSLSSAYFLLQQYPDNYHALLKIYENFQDHDMPLMTEIAGDYITLLYSHADLSDTNHLETSTSQPLNPFQEVTQKLIDKAALLNDLQELLQIELETLKKIKAQPEDSNWLLLLSQNLNVRGESSRAAMILRRLTLLHPDDYDHVRNYLYLLEKCELYNAGIQEVARLSSQHQDRDQFRRFAMVFARESQRFEQGISLGRTWTQQFPKDPEAWIFLGEMKFAKHELRAAYSAYAKASQLSGPHPNVYFQLSRICYQLKEPEDAVAWLKRYREKVGSDTFMNTLLESEMSGNMEFLDLLK